MNIKRYWLSFLAMPAREIVTGTALGVFLAQVLIYCLGYTFNTYSVLLCIAGPVLCNGLIAWARLQGPDAAPNPESKREP